MEISPQKDLNQELIVYKSNLSHLSKTIAKKSNSKEPLSHADKSQAKDCIRKCNSFSLQLIDKRFIPEALDLLKQTENVVLLWIKIIEQSVPAPSKPEFAPALKLLANTYNNIGYLYSQAGNMDNAYQYLVRTLEAETRGDYSSYNKGLTCLNIANLLLSMKFINLH